MSTTKTASERGDENHLESADRIALSFFLNASETALQDDACTEYRAIKKQTAERLRQRGIVEVDSDPTPNPRTHVYARLTKEGATLVEYVFID